jgi:hypothetical protein
MNMTRFMLHCIKIKENFCAVHDEKECRSGQAGHGNLAHVQGDRGVYRAARPDADLHFP